MGIQNSQGSTLMTLADMAVITAEVKIDETDIVSVKLGQAAKVTIDAIPKKSFAGVVTEIGENAIVRSSGLATSQSATGDQEAKDFRVVITLQETPENLRPGLSCTAKIVTASRTSADRALAGVDLPPAQGSGVRRGRPEDRAGRCPGPHHGQGDRQR